MCSKKLECLLGMIQAWRNGHSGVLPTGASSKTMHMVIQIRMWTLSNDIKKAAVGMRLARDSGKGKLFFPMCYRRNKNGQITGPENEHLTPSRGLTSASERRKPLFLRLPGVFLR